MPVRNNLRQEARLAMPNLFLLLQEFEGGCCQEILSTIIGWSKVSLKNTKVDLGINFATTALSGEPMISLARSGAINSIPFLFGPSGFHGSVSDRWEANQVRAGLRQENGKYLKNMEWYQTRLRESEMEQFTLRVERCFLASAIASSFVTNFVEKSKDTLGGSGGVHICHQEYPNYISCRLAFLNELAFKFEGKQNLRSLSGVAMVSFLLNSLMHPGNSPRTAAKNFGKARRSQNSCLLFLKDAFVLVEGEVEYDHVVISTGRPGNLTTRAYGQIKSPELQEAGRTCVWGETFPDVDRPNVRDLHLHDTSKRKTMEMYALAKSVMVMYGLRFFEIF
ncbi:uncharacterized protein EV154DRAFT_488144 [Mucor mucedo]|uniref:uncharacterized protein n=1 Tax=Mucor mucedo TaxID=29922 RepID=UPI002220E699|nr:uncharacterized protein EV154DRAFT_488144 [Mucor mucedo]KAI7868388.1 hypothetical protein EV154DRAFT_488144 [Mucor mucedo]